MRSPAMISMSGLTLSRDLISLDLKMTSPHAAGSKVVRTSRFFSPPEIVILAIYDDLVGEHIGTRSAVVVF